VRRLMTRFWTDSASCSTLSKILTVSLFLTFYACLPSEIREKEEEEKEGFL
jgi:hypothetical protein